MRSKTVVKTKSGKTITIYDGKYKNGVLVGTDKSGKNVKSVKVDNIKVKKLSWV